MQNSEEKIDDKGVGIYKMPEIKEFQEDNIISLDSEKDWYLVQPIETGNNFIQYLESVQNNIELKSRFFVLF